MMRVALFLLMLSNAAFGQAQPPVEKIRTDVVSVQSAVNDVISRAIPGYGVLQAPKGAYLDGYGIVVTVEVALEAPRNPFTGLKTPAEVRKTVNGNRTLVTDQLSNLLKQKVPAIESLGAEESVAVVVNLLNTNAADVPDLPSQIIFSLKKQDASSGSVSVRAYK